MSAATKRRVRVVVEADAHEVSGKCGLLRLDMAPDENGLPPVILVNPAWPGVTVEDVAPAYDWRDGDVVQHSTETWTLTRERGQWLSTRLSDKPGSWTDEAVSIHLSDQGFGWGCLVILRYQAGEQ